MRISKPARRRLKLDFSNLSGYRMSLGMNQADFWKLFGVTQSGGSRYESGRGVPVQVAVLMWLYDTGRIGRDDLEAAHEAVRKAWQKERKKQPLLEELTRYGRGHFFVGRDAPSERKR